MTPKRKILSILKMREFLGKSSGLENERIRGQGVTLAKKTAKKKRFLAFRMDKEKGTVECLGIKKSSE